MAAATTGPGIQKEDLNRLRYGLAVTKAGREALARVFMWSYRGSFPVRTYLTQDLKYTNDKYRRVFDAQQRDKLEASSNTATFDITLLYKLLQHVCGLAEMNDPTWTTPGPQGPSLEHLIYTLKQHRNKLIHDNLTFTDQELRTTLTELSDLIAKILAEAGVQCGTNRQQVDQATKNATEYIGGLLRKIREPLDPSDEASLPQLQQEIKLFKSQITEEVKKLSKQELTDVYKLLYQIVPAPWLHLNITYNPSLAFTRLRLLEDPVIGARPSHKAKSQDSVRPSHKAKGQDINYENILSMRRGDGRVPQCILLTGEGGMGKTTLLKLILEKWVEDPHAIRHLDTVDLVLYVQCRDRHLNTFDDLLRHLLHQTFHDSDVDFQLLKKIILSLNILVLIDGYDEVNDHSGRLVKELLYLPGKDVRLVITTRPGWDQHLSQLVPPTRPRYNILVLGITPERRMEYAERIIKVLVEEESQRSVIRERFTQRLGQMRGFLGEYLNTPLTLTLLALLCVEAPDEFNNLTTNTQVYEKIHNFITSKFVSRLKFQDVLDAEVKCDKFLLFFEEVSLEAFKRKEYDLWPETVKEIREKCDTLGLPQEEVLSNYFTRTSYRQGLNIKWLFGYFHARYQEYCAARGLVAQLLREEEERASHKVSEKSSRIQNILSDILSETDGTVNRSRWLSILLSTTGVLSAEGKLHMFISQVIDVVCEIDKFYVEDRLLEHVAESNGSEHVIQTVCEKLRTKHKWQIRSVDSCVVLPLVLRKVAPKEVDLFLEYALQSQQLLSVLSMLANMEVSLRFSEHNHYIKRNNDLTDNFLEMMTASGSKCKLKVFGGCLPEAAIPRLPHTLERLIMRLTLQQLPVLIRHLPQLPHLDVLGITLDTRSSMYQATLPRLPYQGYMLVLRISHGLTDYDRAIDWCCHLVAQLCPHSRGGYDVLLFKDTHLTSVGGVKLLLALHQRGVTGNELWVSFKNSDEDSDEDSEEDSDEDSVNKMEYLRKLGASLKNFKTLRMW